MAIVPDWISHHTMLRPDHAALIEPDSGRQLTYRQLADHVSRLASVLHGDWQVGRGDRVAFLGYNGIDTFSLLYACKLLGAVFVPLNWRLAQAELVPVLELADPTVILVQPEFAESIALAGRADGREAVGFDDDLAARVDAATPIANVVAVTEDDTWALLFTSGTTGTPKGVIQTHGMALWNAINCQVGAAVGADSVALVLTPCFHTTGLNVYANPTLHCGGTVVCPPRFVPAAALELIADTDLGVTHTALVPAMWQAISMLDGFDQVPFEHLVSRGVGAAAPSPGLLGRYADRGAPLDGGYGMTETGPTQMLLPQGRVHDKSHTVGRPVLHGEHRVVDGDGNDVAPGERGELWVRGPAVTPGYWDNPEATAAAFTADGWFRTGDVVEVDPDGFFMIVDRMKEMYISGGENVYPGEVERIIGSITGVAEAAVIAVADDRWGEVGVAFVECSPGSKVAADEVLAVCRDQLAGFKVPSKIHVVDELPRTATGKVSKADLSVP